MGWTVNTVRQSLTNLHSQKCLRCHQERFGRDKRQVRNSTIPKMSNLPPMAVTGLALKTKFHSCSFCGLPGHTVGMKCQAVTRWGGQLLGKDPTVRHVFCERLQKIDSDFVLDPLPIEFLNHKIVTINNRKSKGIVLHGRYLIQHDNVVIECTLLMDNGEPCDTYRNQLFHVGSVCHLIRASVSRVTIDVINKKTMPMNMDVNNFTDFSSIPMTWQTTQDLSRLHCSQLTQDENNPNLPHAGTITADNCSAYGFGNSCGTNVKEWI